MIKIHINAGHGGKDPGACGNRLKEKDITLKLALKLENIMKQNFEVSLTRAEDIFIPLVDIVKKANAEKADLFISLHCNSAENPKANGIETLVYSYSGENKNVGDLIQNNLIIKTGLTDRGIKERPDLVVLNSTDMTAVLIELGFISNKYDSLKINDDKFLDCCVDAIYRAICEYYEISVENKPIIPIWQEEGIKGLVSVGVIKDENYWRSRMGDMVTVGELMGILGRFWEEI